MSFNLNLSSKNKCLMLADDDDEKVKRMLKSKHLKLMFTLLCHLCLMYIKLNIYTHTKFFNEGLTVIEAKTRFSTFLMLDKSPTVASNSMNCVQTFLASLAGRVSADKTLSNKTRVLLSSFKWIRKSR